MQMVDEVTPLSKGRSRVRFVHVGGNVKEEVTVKLGKQLINLTPFEIPKYYALESKQ